MIYFNIVLFLRLPIYLFASAILLLSHVLHRLPLLIICDINCMTIFGIQLPENRCSLFFKVRPRFSAAVLADLIYKQHRNKTS